LLSRFLFISSTTGKGKEMSFYEKAAMIISVVVLAIAIFLHYKYGRD